MSLSIQQQLAFEEAVKHGIINLADVLEKNEIMKNKEILEQHEQFCKIWQATDGRYKTKLPDESKSSGKKMVAKTSREDLEKCIIKYYKDRQEQKGNPRTMKALYPEWIKYKAVETSKANANKLQWVWNTYFVDSDIAGMDMQIIDVITLKTWFLNVIEKHKLSNKKYKEMKSVANMLFDYAVEKNIVSANISRSVHGISSKKFSEPTKKEAAEQVYIDDEIQLILEQAEKQYKKTKNPAYLAVCLNFALGLRVGELVGLTIKDIDLKEKTINIDHQLQRTSQMQYIIEPPKTEAGIRVIPMQKEVCECFKRIIQNRRKPKVEPMVGGKVGFLYLDKNEMPMVALHWEKYFQHIVEKYNKIYKVQMPKITPHVCRHTYCSHWASSGMNPKHLQYLMGHSDISVTLNTYTHVDFDNVKKEVKSLEKAVL